LIYQVELLALHWNLKKVHGTKTNAWITHLLSTQDSHQIES